MKLSAVPDLASGRRLALLALVITLGACLVMMWTQGAAVGRSLGDTDDAMRLVMVRDLLHGRGWYDQRILRLQPPLGTYMHWSRLLDGGLAAVTWLFGLWMRSDQAELATRFIWPMLWIYPAVVSALVIARSLGGRTAVFCCALLMAVDIQLYIQFRPGRIDHHNVQITMTMVAAACAMAGANRARWAAAAGFATALGLAIGIEALAFHALIGASLALRAALDTRLMRSARAYGLALAGAGGALFLLETPPGRWSLSVCDALGFNLVTALLVAGLGLAAWASVAGRWSQGRRLVVLA